MLKLEASMLQLAVSILRLLAEGLGNNEAKHALKIMLTATDQTAGLWSEVFTDAAPRN
jgi:hypothetical protein